MVIRVNDHTLWAFRSDQRPLIAYLQARLKIHGGTLFGTPTPSTLKKLGWSRSTYFKNVRAMVKADLATKDPWGNYRLLPSRDFVQLFRFKNKPNRYKCTLILNPNSTRKQIISAIRDKFAERRIAQLLWAERNQNKEASKITVARKRKQRANAGSTDGFISIAATNLSLHMGISTKTLGRWKKDTRNIEHRSSKTIVGNTRYHRLLVGMVGTYIRKDGAVVKVEPTRYRSRRYPPPPAPPRPHRLIKETHRRLSSNSKGF